MTEMAKRKLNNLFIDNESLMDSIPDDDAPAAADRAIAMIRQRGEAFLAGSIDQESFLHTLKTQSSVIVKAYSDCKNLVTVSIITLVVANIAGTMAMIRKGEFD